MFDRLLPGKKSMLITGAFVSAALFMSILAGCQSEQPAETAGAETGVGQGIVIEGAWGRPAAVGQMGVGYMQIRNSSSEADTLTAVSSEVARQTELHESYELEEGMMGMREIEQLAVPAGSTVSLEPGGLHIMLMQLTEELAEGDQVELTLTFTSQGEVPVTLQIRRP